MVDEWLKRQRGKVIDWKHLPITLVILAVYTGILKFLDLDKDQAGVARRYSRAGAQDLDTDVIT